ncbi:MAG: glycosyltransferase family 1 protein [Coxiellaceae bacterium]|nr:glycosyltransferase family 1 protein [Coxiellaceae bacterium]
MKLVINAFNIQIGGGLMHLIELLSAADPQRYGFSKVVIFAGEKTLAQLPEKSWLEKKSHPKLNGNFLSRIKWNLFYLNRELQDTALLFIPGGTYLGKFRPFVGMFQNALPFEPKETKQFLVSAPTSFLKWRLLRITQGATFSQNTAAISPSGYLKSIIIQAVKKTVVRNFSVIPHGINPIFFAAPRIENKLLSQKAEIHISYVSRIDIYKHQSMVVHAVAALRKTGLPVVLHLYGDCGHPLAMQKMHEAMHSVDPGKQFIVYHGYIEYENLPIIYQKTDIFVFASSCESISSILLEAMASGLPIACSKIPVASEVVKNAGVYFDPEDTDDIKRAIALLISDDKLRSDLAQKAYLYATEYSWKNCADKTFALLQKTAECYGKKACAKN